MTKIKAQIYGISDKFLAFLFKPRKNSHSCFAHISTRFAQRELIF